MLNKNEDTVVKRVEEIKRTWRKGRSDGTSAFTLATLLLVALVLGITLFLAVHWVVWLIWTAVIPLIFTTWPVSITTPGFWVFTGFAVILRWVIRGIFGAKKND